MNCPACGAGNPDGARFCVECQTRLPESARHVVTEESNLSEAPFEFRPPGATKGEGLSTASLVLGFLGIPGIICGALALTRHRPGHGKALAGVVLGSVVTAALAVLAIASLSGRDPLRAPLTAARIAGFVTAVNGRADQVQAQADSAGARLGPGADAEMEPVYADIQGARDLAASMDSTWTNDDLDTARDSILGLLDQARDRLAGR